MILVVTNEVRTVTLPYHGSCVGVTLTEGRCLESQGELFILYVSQFPPCHPLPLLILLGFYWWVCVL